MPRANLSGVLRHLHRLRGAGPAAADGDGRLLRRFVALRDESAFTDLLARHGPMVLGVCRRVLGDGPDAEDAFQATFLVLVRKAGALRDPSTLANWLYGVAVRVARNARLSAARRRNYERKAIPMRRADDLDAVAWRDLRPVLDEELERLPEKYRAPLVLCYLEGHTYEEAARRLGWASGTVCGRLARAKDLLRSRLVRRGLAPAAVAAGLLCRDATSAVVAAPLLDATLKAALVYAGASGMAAGAVSAPVAALTKGVLNAMFWGKVRTALLVVLALGVLAAGAGAARQALTAPLAEGESPPAVKGEEKTNPDKDGPAPGGRKDEALPPGALLRLGTTRLRHDGGVSGIAFGAGGKTIVAAGQGRPVRVWDAETGKEVRSFEALQDDWQCLAISPDGKVLALSGNSSDPDRPTQWISLRDASTGKEVRQLKTAAHPPYRMAFSPDGKTLATTNYGPAVLLDVATGRQLRKLVPDPFDGKRTYCLAFSPDGKTVATGGEDGTVRLWEAATGKEVGQLPKQEQHIAAVAFAPDGKALATGSYSEPVQDKQVGVLKLWDVADRKEIGRLEGHGGQVNHLAFGRDGKVLASAGADNTVRLWDTATHKETRLLGLGINGASAIAFSPDGKTLAAASGNHVRLWDVATGREPAWRTGHVTPIWRLAYSPDGKTLASVAAWDTTVCVWDAATGQELHRLAGPRRGTVRSLTYSPDGKALATTESSDEGAVRVWDLTTGRESYRLGEKVKYYRVAFAPAGDLLAVSDEEALRLYSRKTGLEVRRLGEHVHSVNVLAFSPDGKFLATAHEGDKVRLWDVATGKALHELKGHGGPVLWLASAPDRPTLITTTSEGDPAVQLWDAAAGKELRRIKVSAKGPRGHWAVSPDGRILAMANHTVARLELWDVAAGRQMAVCHGPPDWTPVDPGITYWFQAVAFAPDGRALVTTDLDGRVQLWEAGTGQEIRRFGEPGRSHGNVLAFSPDGRAVAAGDGDTIPLWDVTGRAKAGGLRRTDLTPKERERLGDDLGGDDVPKAHDALWALVAAGDQAVPFLREKLRPRDADANRVARLIADLDAADFEAREGATAELAKLGPSAEAALRRALKDQPSPEVRRRAEALLEKVDRLSRLTTRPLQVLEQVGTPEARKVLEELARGAPEARLTQEARASLERLKRHP